MITTRRICAVAALIVLYFLLPSMVYIWSLIMLFSFIFLVLVAVEGFDSLRNNW